MGADPLDHATAEIFLDPFEGAWGDYLELGGLELETMGAVVLPYAKALDIFSGGDGGRRADDGDQVALPLHLGAENAEAGFLAVERDPFDGTAETFERCVCLLGLWFHEQ